MAEWVTKTDHWVECEGGTWVRWSAVVAAAIEAGVAKDEYSVVLTLTTGQRLTAWTVASRDDGRRVVLDLLGKLSEDWRPRSAAEL